MTFRGIFFGRRCFCKSNKYSRRNCYGKTIKYFQIGRFFTPYDEDFEGIAITPSNFYMVTGKGVLYEFKEGKHKESVTYKTYDLNLSAKYNLEGLCYDSKNNQLLLVAKGNIDPINRNRYIRQWINLL